VNSHFPTSPSSSSILGIPYPISSQFRCGAPIKAALPTIFMSDERTTYYFLRQAGQPASMIVTKEAAAPKQCGSASTSHVNSSEAGTTARLWSRSCGSEMGSNWNVTVHCLDGVEEFALLGLYPPGARAGLVGVSRCGRGGVSPYGQCSIGQRGAWAMTAQPCGVSEVCWRPICTPILVATADIAQTLPTPVSTLPTSKPRTKVVALTWHSFPSHPPMPYVPVLRSAPSAA
jgi:hypothetical protein